MSALPRLEDLGHCFQGVVPAVVATCSKDGEPNVTFLSQVHYVDPRHVALSCQFFNKTRANVAENPYATVNLFDPITFDVYRLSLRFLRAETEGPLFDTMAARIQVIATHTGMAGIFELISSDVYEVLELVRLDAAMLPPDPSEPCADTATELSGGPLTELRGLQIVTDRIARAQDLESLLTGALESLDQSLGFSHSMVLVHEEPCERLVAIASRGYDRRGVGAEVPLGAGTIGTAAERRRMVKVSGVARELRYGRAIRGRVTESGGADRLRPEIPLPGLEDAQAQLALPLLAGDRLVGVLAVESRDPLAFDDWDEAFLTIVANQIALGIDRMQSDDEDAAAPTQSPVASVAPAGARRRFVLYRNDDSVFVDDEYLIRNVPGRILWKLLRAYRDERRTEFSNRELRLDPGLGLPPLRDNLESRLILLRRRLEERCPDLRIVPVRRGRFALEVACEVDLLEKDSA